LLIGSRVAMVTLRAEAQFPRQKSLAEWPMILTVIHRCDLSQEISMKRLLIAIGLLSLFMFTSGCSHTLKQPEWVFEKAAVQIHVKADNKLNMYNNKAHTLYVCFYQLRELSDFDQLTQDEAGIRQLLECRMFDDSVAAANSKVIHAGENITLTMDRAERARYIAMVAGYSSDLTNDRVVKRHRFQVYKTKEGFFKKVYECSPCVLDVEVSLGPYQIEYSKILPSEVDEDDEMECANECE
jgi:type VI secretion system VasD/TssJ family lipoprotein